MNDDLIESLDDALEETPEFEEPGSAEEVARAIDLANQAMGEVGQILARKGVTAPEAVGAIHELIEKASDAQSTAAQALYYQAIMEVMKASMIQPNGAQTLVGTGGDGTVYAVGSTVNLFPSQGGVVSTTPFELQWRMIMLEMQTLLLDANRGWQIVGNTLKVNVDPYSGITKDCNVSIWESQTTGRRPLASLMTIEGPSSQTAPLQFSAQVRLHGPDPAAFEGITILIWDGRCFSQMARMSKSRYWKYIDAARKGILPQKILQQAGRLLKPATTKTPRKPLSAVNLGLRRFFNSQ